MFKYTILILLSIVLLSCQHSGGNNHLRPQGQPQGVASVPAPNDQKINQATQTQRYLQVDSSGIFLFPLYLEPESFDRSYKSYSKSPDVNHWNIVFLNGHTGEYRLLSNSKMLIRRYSLHTLGSAEADLQARVPKALYYEITTIDYNGDSAFTDADPACLFTSDREGRGLRQLSPANLQLMNWEYMPSIRKIILTLRKDSDQNRKFDEEDEIITYMIDPVQDKEAHEVFSGDFRNQLRQLCNRDWKNASE